MSELSLGEEANKGAEPTVESTSEALQGYLVMEAKSALNQFTFQSRNARMANAVGLESSIGAAKSMGKPELADQLRDGFIKAADEAGQKFSGAFDELGRKLEDGKSDYDKAVKAAGEVALAHLPGVLETLGINVDIDSVLKNVTFNDVLKVTARELNQPVPRGLTPEQIKQSLHRTAKGDYFEDQIDTIPFAENPALSEQEEQGLDLAVRLANATWKVGQVHRAAWEGNDDRISPAKREAFNPYDLLKEVQRERGWLRKENLQRMHWLELGLRYTKMLSNISRYLRNLKKLASQRA